MRTLAIAVVLLCCGGAARAADGQGASLHAVRPFVIQGEVPQALPGKVEELVIAGLQRAGAEAELVDVVGRAGDPGGHSAAPSPQTQQALQQAREAYLQLNFKIAIKQYAAIIDALEQSWEEPGTVDAVVAAHMGRGLAALADGDTAIAQRDFQEAARLRPTTKLSSSEVPPEALELYRKAQERLREESSARLNVTSTPAFAAVLLDDVEIGKSPIAQLRVQPGRHAVRARLPGYRDAVQMVTLKPGATVEVELTLDELARARALRELREAIQKNRAPSEVVELARQLLSETGGHDLVLTAIARTEEGYTISVARIGERELRIAYAPVQAGLRDLAPAVQALAGSVVAPGSAQPMPLAGAGAPAPGGLDFTRYFFGLSAAGDTGLVAADTAADATEEESDGDLWLWLGIGGATVALGAVATAVAIAVALNPITEEVVDPDEVHLQITPPSP